MSKMDLEQNSKLEKLKKKTKLKQIYLLKKGRKGFPALQAITIRNEMKIEKAYYNQNVL